MKQLSRRQIQKIYIPGTLLLLRDFSNSTRLSVGMVVGWHLHERNIPKNKFALVNESIKTHNACVLIDGTIKNYNWTCFQEQEYWVVDILAGENTDAYFNEIDVG